MCKGIYIVNMSSDILQYFCTTGSIACVRKVWVFFSTKAILRWDIWSIVWWSLKYKQLNHNVLHMPWQHCWQGMFNFSILVNMTSLPLACEGLPRCWGGGGGWGWCVCVGGGGGGGGAGGNQSKYVILRACVCGKGDISWRLPQTFFE